MNIPPEELVDFADLRRVAIDYAQKASGKIWTDYNLHDPGVTLLEQTAFALSELAYMTTHPTRDLLTAADGTFKFREQALFPPRSVLRTAPVTATDMESWLAHCPDIARARLSPVPGRPGLYDIILVPMSEEQDTASLTTNAMHAFDCARPLCWERASVQVATCCKKVLTGQIEIAPQSLPEQVAAEMYHAVAMILRGRPHGPLNKGATRKAIYDAPEKLFEHNGSHRPNAINLDTHLIELRTLPGVRDIGDLSLQDMPNARETDPRAPCYFASALPRTASQIGLKLNLNGAPVALDPTRIREEFSRIAAQRIGQEHPQIDRADFDVMQPGRHREIKLSQVDSLLPMLYRASGYKRTDPQNPVTHYRSAVDGYLSRMTRDLDGLDQFFAAETRTPQAPDDQRRALLADPVRYHQRIALLDYLIALQGEEMPAVRHTGLHHYLSVSGRHWFEFTWRLDYLFAQPRINATRATGFGPIGPGGFLARLGHLADLDVSGKRSLSQGLADFGLRLDPAAGFANEAQNQVTATLLSPILPLDMLVEHDDQAPPYGKDDLLKLSPFLTEGALHPRLFAQLSDPDSFFIAPIAGGWQILLDRADSPPYRLARTTRKEDAKACVNRLRRTWVALHHASEGAILIEDIRLRGPEFATNTADLMLTGWTARSALPGYRSYVKSLIEVHAPAHILIRPHWLTLDQMARVEALNSDVSAGKPDAAAELRACIADLGSAP